MKLLNPKLPVASIVVKKYLFDILEADANYVSNIPNYFKSFQSKPHPYFFLEEANLMRIVKGLRDDEMNKTKSPQNKELIDDCNQIIYLLVNVKPFLIFISLTA